MRKTDATRYRPVEHRRNHCARLADEGDIPRRCCQMRKSGVEPKPRHHDADTVRPDDAQEVRLCCVEHGLLQAAALLTELPETGRNDDSCARTPLGQLTDETRHCVGRRDDDRKVRALWQACYIRMDRRPVNRVVMGVDQHHLAGKPGAAKVARDHCADRAGTRRSAHQRDRSRCEQLVEIANGHRSC